MMENNNVTMGRTESETPKAGITMNVYTALSKRKILQKQLDDVLSSPVIVCAAALKTANTINGKNREDAINDMKSAYDKPRALIKNIQAINSAIAISNATTKVQVGGTTYTVEELIYRMIHISDEVKFYNAIIKNLNTAKLAIEKHNSANLSEEAISHHVDKILPTMVPVDATAEDRSKQAAAIRNMYVENTTMELVDPYNLIKRVEDILAELTEFKEEVNNALNLSNIQTMITVDLCD